MRTPLVLLAVILTLAGCAKDSQGRDTSAAATPQGRACMSQVNQDRSRGRSAPNWNLYDYCMRQHQGG